jgi:hypothetical protein
MLGEMRDVIGDLTMSVNGLKDIVSDLRARRSTPVQDSGRASGSGRRRGSRGQGQRGGARGWSMGGPVGKDYIADDKGQGNEDHGEPKNYKLRVSIVILI